MSGDSPLHNNRTAEAFSFNSDSNQEGRPQLLDSKQVFSNEGRSSPVPTTSKEVAVQSGPTDEKVGDKPGKVCSFTNEISVSNPQKDQLLIFVVLPHALPACAIGRISFAGGKGEVLAEPIGDKDKEDKAEAGSPTSNHHSDGEDQCDYEEKRNGKKDSGEHDGKQFFRLLDN